MLCPPTDIFFLRNRLTAEWLRLIAERLGLVIEQVRLTPELPRFIANIDSEFNKPKSKAGISFPSLSLYLKRFPFELPNVMATKILMLFAGLASFPAVSIAFSEQATLAQTTPSREEVCAIVTAMPGAENTDELLSLLGTTRQEVVSDLEAMRSNMEQYDAEGYGWQNVIDGSSALEPRPGSWLIGALRMACESSL